MFQSRPYPSESIPESTEIASLYKADIMKCVQIRSQSVSNLVISYKLCQARPGCLWCVP